MRLVIGFIVVLILVGIGAFSLLKERRIEVYRDRIVTVGEIHRPITDIAAHLSTQQYLSIFGTTYFGLRGINPYYLSLPELDSILFVTEEPRGRVNFHIVRLKAKEAIRIDGDGSGFGWALNSDRSPSEKHGDYIESVETNRVLIATRSEGWKETMLLNLATKAIERRDTFRFDSAGQVTNHSVQTSIGLKRR